MTFGCTISEAMARLSYSEFRRWCEYRRLRGSLHLGMRIERGTAMLATLYANAHSKKGGFKIYDFMQHDAERPVSLEEAMQTWA